MLDLKFIRENPELVKQGTSAKGRPVELAAILKLDAERRALQTEVDSLRQGRGDKVTDIEAARAKKQQLKVKEDELKKTSEQLDIMLSAVTNLPRPDVKVGKDETENEVVATWGEPTKFAFKPLDYMALAAKHDLIDIERAGKVSGSRFGYLKNDLALLEFALIQYGLSKVLPHGFTPVIPPVLINEKAMRGMGYLDHGGEDETYHFKDEKMYLVGTSEQSIGPMHMDEVLAEKDLPRRYASFSTCFRREAGSYGKDTRGILRVHQFDKLEMVVYAKPEESDKEHEFLVGLEREIMQGLGLPHQLVRLCTGDLGDPSARTYDIETWLPSENKYRETHSCSTTTDYQSRRLNIRYKNAAGKLGLVHMLNGTVFTNRTSIAILENYQQVDGRIMIPEVLRVFMGNREFIG